MNFRAHFIIWNGPKKYENFQKKIKNTSWNWKSNMKMVLKSLEAKENDKILEKKNFSKFLGVSSPPKTPLFRFLGGFGGGRNPPKFWKKFFFKILSFTLGSKLSRTIFIFDFQLQEVFLIFFWKFSYFLYLGTHEMGRKMAFSCHIRFKWARDFLKAVLESECKNI